uniref:G-protein coupled receptors family 1 profile domain-containing protein n=1 Tax=Monodon monoceros TaxID=40151 RepID=A0A8C6CDB6_MONMO
MAEGNWTRFSELILMSFSSLPSEIQSLLFLIFLIIYLVTLLGNSLIILVTLADPMNLSFIEIGFNLVIVPKMLGTLIAQDTTISFLGCATQMYFSFFFGVFECFLLATMAYDRYVAICNPLHYPVIMNPKTWAKLTVASWFPGIPMATVQTTWLFSFPFCGTKVNHFFCDSSPVLRLVCADTALFEIYAIVGTILVVMIPCLLILCSYTCIIAAILKIPSAKGKHKAFSTCSSHLLVVSLFYVSLSLIYFHPKSNNSPESKKVLSLSYTVMTPILNPIIYSLRNNEGVIEALVTYGDFHLPGVWMPNEILGRRITWRNWTIVNEFVHVGFSALSSELQALLFLLFLIIYLVTLMGNVLIILVTTEDSALQSPMYFFLRNLSFLEIGFNLVFLSKVLGTLIIQNTTISFLDCATQMYFFFFFGAAECCLLTTMTYDRYVAICDPLHYPVIMGFPVATVQTTWIFSFPFCGPNKALTATVLFIFFPFLLILGSILSTIFRMPSAKEKCKVFSTCSSHFLVVSLFYSTAILTYFRPQSSTSPVSKKLLSLSYRVVTPMLNPIIYSLRNSEVKTALRWAIHRTWDPQKL